MEELGLLQACSLPAMRLILPPLSDAQGFVVSGFQPGEVVARIPGVFRYVVEITFRYFF